MFFKNDKNIPLIVAEIGQVHGGSLKKIFSFIDKCSSIGVDYVKFQMHYADFESTYDEPFRKGFNFSENTRYHYWKKMEFNFKEWELIISKCKKKKIGFLCSPFSLEAYKILKKLKVKIFKIGSGEFFSQDIIEHILRNKDSVILSTGLANTKEIDTVVKKLLKNKNDLTLLQCTTKYPSDLKDVGLNVLTDFKKKYKCKIGLSDHTGNIAPALYCIFKEYDLLEVHITDNKEKMKRPDDSSSLTFDELKKVCDIKNNFLIMNKNKVNKDLVAKKLSYHKKIFTKSIALTKSIGKDQIIKKEYITFKKPGTGIPAKNIIKVIGKRTKKKLSPLRLVKLKDLY
jgi:N,N'-diacetyllegionaminate synthase